MKKQTATYLTRMQLADVFPINTYEGWRRVSKDSLPYVVRGPEAIYRRDYVVRYIENGGAMPKRGRPRNCDRR